MTIVQFPRLRRFILRLRSVVHHSKYHTPAAIVTRIAVCAATLIWAGIVLSDASALARTLDGAILGRFAPYWAYGFALATIAAVLLLRIWRDSEPHWIGVAGYFVLFAAWLFVAIFTTLAWPVGPGIVAAVCVITGLAVYAFLASPIPAHESRC